MSGDEADSKSALAEEFCTTDYDDSPAQNVLRTWLQSHAEEQLDLYFNKLDAISKRKNTVSSTNLLCGEMERNCGFSTCPFPHSLGLLTSENPSYGFRHGKSYSRSTVNNMNSKRSSVKLKPRDTKESFTFEHNLSTEELLQEYRQKFIYTRSNLAKVNKEALQKAVFTRNQSQAATVIKSKPNVPNCFLNKKNKAQVEGEQQEKENKNHMEMEPLENKGLSMNIIRGKYIPGKKFTTSISKKQNHKLARRHAIALNVINLQSLDLSETIGSTKNQSPRKKDSSLHTIQCAPKMNSNLFKKEKQLHKTNIQITKLIEGYQINHVQDKSTDFIPQHNRHQNFKIDYNELCNLYLLNQSNSPFKTPKEEHIIYENNIKSKTSLLQNRPDNGFQNLKITDCIRNNENEIHRVDQDVIIEETESVGKFNNNSENNNILSKNLRNSTFDITSSYDKRAISPDNSIDNSQSHKIMHDEHKLLALSNDTEIKDLILNTNLNASKLKKLLSSDNLEYPKVPDEKLQRNIKKHSKSNKQKKTKKKSKLHSKLNQTAQKPKPSSLNIEEVEAIPENIDTLTNKFREDIASEIFNVTQKSKTRKANVLYNCSETDFNKNFDSTNEINSERSSLPNSKINIGRNKKSKYTLGILSKQSSHTDKSYLHSNIKAFMSTGGTTTSELCPSPDEVSKILQIMTLSNQSSLTLPSIVNNKNILERNSFRNERNIVNSDCGIQTSDDNLDLQVKVTKNLLDAKTHGNTVTSLVSCNEDSSKTTSVQTDLQEQEGKGNFPNISKLISNTTPFQGKVYDKMKYQENKIIANLQTLKSDYLKFCDEKKHSTDMKTSNDISNNKTLPSTNILHDIWKSKLNVPGSYDTKLYSGKNIMSLVPNTISKISETSSLFSPSVHQDSTVIKTPIEINAEDKDVKLPYKKLGDIKNHTKFQVPVINKSVN